MIKMTPDDFITLGEQHGFKPYYDDESWYLLYDKTHYIASMEEDEDNNILSFEVVTEWELDPEENRVWCKYSKFIDNDEEFKAAFEKSIMAYKLTKQEYELKKIKKDFK